MAKSRFQFSLKTLLIGTLLTSAVLGIAVYLYIQRRNAMMLHFGRTVVEEMLQECYFVAEIKSPATFKPAASPFLKNDGNDWDYVIYESRARKAEADEKLVHFHLHMTLSGGRPACEITTMDGSESQAFVNDLRAQLQKMRIAVSVKDSN